MRHHGILADLSCPKDTINAHEQLVTLLPKQASHYRLINNAGTVDPVSLCNKLSDSTAIAQALQLNVGAVISLTATFLALIENTAADKRILNISSGAGRRPVAGWAVYGSSKAALDYYTQTLAAEDHGVRCVSLAPGVINTSMQATIGNKIATTSLTYRALSISIKNSSFHRRMIRLPILLNTLKAPHSAIRLSTTFVITLRFTLP